MSKKFTEDRVVRLSKKKEQLLNEEQYAEYLRRLKAQDEKSYLGTMSQKQRMRYHGLLRFLLRVDRISKGIRVRKLNTQMPNVPKDRQVIFVLTHVGRDDISIFNEVIGEHYTILSGDYESLHNNLQGFVIALNGTVFFDMKSKEERSSIEDRVVEVLKGGDNILCSMEAAWNLSANEIVMELFPGMLRAALRSNALIVPVGIERFSYRLYGINVAQKVFDVNEYIAKYQDTGQAIEIAREDLRQIMADLKFQTYFEDYIQKKITISRELIGDFEAYEKWFKADILKGWTFTEEIVNEKKYRNKVKPQYAFAYVVDKYKKNLEQFDNDKFLCELMQEIANPIYPTCVRRALRNLAEDYMR